MTDNQPIDNTAKSYVEAIRELRQSVSKTFDEIIEKYNHNHDEKGRFSNAARSVLPQSAHTVDAVTEGNPYAGTSLEKHITFDKDGNPQISKERMALYSKIMQDCFEGIEKPDAADKSIVFMGGGGASGKTYLIDNGYVDVQPQSAKKAVFINADDIKAMLPEYQEMVANKDKTAAAYCHAESSYLSHVLLDKAMENGYNVVFDGTASNLKSTQQKATNFREKGYGVEAHYVQCPLETALKGNAERYDRTGRYVPDDVIIKAHKSVSKNFEKIVDSGCFDKVDLTLSDHKNPPRVIASAGKGEKLSVSDKSAYKDFLDKANWGENP